MKNAIVLRVIGSVIIPIIPISLCDNNKNDNDKNKNMKTILGFGFSGVDYIATVSKFPSPDDKIRTLGGIIYDGGGNCGNTMSTVGKLGSSLFKNNNYNIQSKIITKIAADSNGNFVQKGLEENHININDIVVSPFPAQTGFVYVIVDNDTKTRTCIATLPNAEITDEEITNKINNNILKDISFIHFDSRHTQAALKLASLASTLSIPMSIDLEKDRPPYLKQLLPYCNIVFTNEHAVQKLFDNITIEANAGVIKDIDSNDNGSIMTSEELIRRVQLMVYSFSNKNLKNSKVHTVISTLGSNGSILIRKKDSTINTLSYKGITTNSEMNELKMKLMNCNLHVKQYEYHCNDSKDVYEIVTCSCFRLSPNEVVDTTGAGDSYIGGFLVGYVSGLSLDECMKLGTLIATNVIRNHGARAGIITGEQLRSILQNKGT